MKISNASLTGESEDINIDTKRSPPTNILRLKMFNFLEHNVQPGQEYEFVSE
jgi:hypothetical protein